MNSDVIRLDTNEPYVTTHTDVAIIKGGTMITNSCWTIITGRSEADDLAKRMNLGGILASAQSCIKTAVDGYTLSGFISIGKAGNNFTGDTSNGSSANTNAASPLADANTIKFVDLDGIAPFDGVIGQYLAGGEKAINFGSPVAIHSSFTASYYHTFYLISADIWYANSALISLTPTEANNATGLKACVDMTATTYGQLWGIYSFLKDDSTGAKIGA